MHLNLTLCLYQDFFISLTREREYGIDFFMAPFKLSVLAQSRYWLGIDSVYLLSWATVR